MATAAATRQLVRYLRITSERHDLRETYRRLSPDLLEALKPQVRAHLLARGDHQRPHRRQSSPLPGRRAVPRRDDRACQWWGWSSPSAPFPATRTGTVLRGGSGVSCGTGSTTLADYARSSLDTAHRVRDRWCSRIRGHAQVTEQAIVVSARICFPGRDESAGQRDEPTPVPGT